MRPINTDALRRALDNLDTCRNAWGLLQSDGSRYGPWGQRSNGDPQVKPQLVLRGGVLPQIDDTGGADHAQKCLELALVEFLPQIVESAKKRALAGVEQYEANVKTLAEGKRIS